MGITIIVLFAISSALLYSLIRLITNHAFLDTKDEEISRLKAKVSKLEHRISVLETINENRA